MKDDSVIREGDLVMVVRGCGCVSGHVFLVIGFEDAPSGIKHVKCGFSMGRTTLALCEVDDKHERPIPVSWLRKIPPLSEPETRTREEETT